MKMERRFKGHDLYRGTPFFFSRHFSVTAIESWVIVVYNK